MTAACNRSILFVMNKLEEFNHRFINSRLKADYAYKQKAKMFGVNEPDLSPEVRKERAEATDLLMRGERTELWNAYGELKAMIKVSSENNREYGKNHAVEVVNFMANNAQSYLNDEIIDDADMTHIAKQMVNIYQR